MTVTELENLPPEAGAAWQNLTLSMEALDECIVREESIFLRFFFLIVYLSLWIKFFIVDQGQEQRNKILIEK